MADKNDALNIYQMYVQNGNRCGFWVKRDSWAANIARITSIAGKFEGPLDGEAPYFKNPKVRGDVYLEDTGKMVWRSGGSGANHDITAAGTFGYKLVSAPSWWREP
jgi:hypothetical protein